MRRCSRRSILPPVIIFISVSFCHLQDSELFHFAHRRLQQQIPHRWKMLEPKPEKDPEKHI